MSSPRRFGIHRNSPDISRLCRSRKRHPVNPRSVLPLPSDGLRAWQIALLDALGIDDHAQYPSAAVARSGDIAGPAGNKVFLKRHAIGVQICDLPITPEKILRALETKEAA